MTDPQFRAWIKNKLQAAAARPGYMTPYKKARFTPAQIIADLEGILKEARTRAPKL